MRIRLGTQATKVGPDSAADTDRTRRTVQESTGLFCREGLHRRGTHHPPHHAQPRLARRGGAGRVNVTELVRLLQAEHVETAARADSLREQIERPTTALVETEARLAELTATSRSSTPLPRPYYEPTRAEGAPVYQRIVIAFTKHPRRVIRRPRPTRTPQAAYRHEPSINLTPSRLGRLVRQGLLDQPGRGHYQKGNQRPLSGGSWCRGMGAGQAGNWFSLRICRSKARAGTRRRRVLTRPAVGPAG